MAETLPVRHPLAAEPTDATHRGDLGDLGPLLHAHPGLATARIPRCDDRGSRTPLPVATDWPGHVPNSAAAVTRRSMPAPTSTLACTAYLSSAIGKTGTLNRSEAARVACERG
jgi:hypothetical protein